MGLDALDVFNSGGADDLGRAIRETADAAGSPATPPPQPAGTGDAASAAGGAGSAEGRPVLPEDGPAQALAVLSHLFGPGDAGGAYTLRRFGGRWWLWQSSDQGARWYALEDDDTLLAAVRRWLTMHDVSKWNSRAGRYLPAPYKPTQRATEDILRAACDVVTVRAESMPCWLPADFDQLGRPIADADRWRSLAQSEGPIRPDAVVAFRNGLLDVDAWVAGTVRLLPHTPRWFAASCLDTDADPATLELDEADLEAELEARAPAFFRFVREISRGSQAWADCLQRFVGYCLTPNTSLDKMLWVQGPPGSGKTTLQEAIEAALGAENCAGTDLDALSDRFGIAPLVGKLLAVIPELHVGNMTNVARALQRLKAISGGSPQAIEEKFTRVAPRVRMTCKFLVTPNEEPRLPDASAAILRRLVVLPTFSAPPNPDPELIDKLEAERGAVRLWALLGLRRLWGDVAEGRPAFDQPEEGRAILESIEAASSPVRQFLREACVLQAGSSVFCDALYKLWGQWCDEQGHQAGSQAGFGRKLRAAVAGVDRVQAPREYGRRRLYVGVRPRADADGDEPPFQPVQFCDHAGDPYLGQDAPDPHWDR